MASHDNHDNNDVSCKQHNLKMRPDRELETNPYNYRVILDEDGSRQVYDDERLIPYTPKPAKHRSLLFCLVVFLLAIVAATTIVSACTLSFPSTTHSPPAQDDAPVHVNHQRWAKVLTKLADGKQITIGFHGGSITFQSWAYHTQLSALLMKSFPIDERWYVNDTTVYRNATTNKPEHHMISRAASAMTSDAASLCVSQSFVHEDVDVVSLEYAVNDHFAIEIASSDNPIAAFAPTDNIERFARGYLTRPDGPAIMMPLFAFEGTRTAEAHHMKAAKHYGIPTVSFSKEYFLDWRMSIGAIASQYTPAGAYPKHDPIHPNANGHHFMAQLIHTMIKRMYDSYIASNLEDLAFSPSMSRSSHPRLSLLQSQGRLPPLLNPAVQWTSSPRSFCRLMFTTFWKTSQAPEQSKDANVVESNGISWHKGFHPDWKASYRPDDLTQSGQHITFQTPVPFQRAGILFVFRTWNTTWANGTVHLSSSSRGPECHTEKVEFQSTWSSKSTQTAAVVVWSAPSIESSISQSTNPSIDNSCVRDLITITKTSSGDLRVAGFYSN